MRTVLICHADDPVGREVLAGWLASFSDLAGVVSIREPKGRLWGRVRREFRRSGAVRFFDVLAFRLYYALALRGRDRRWQDGEIARLNARYPPPSLLIRVLETPSPNSPESVAFLKELRPDVAVARCKTLLKKSVFTAARSGTFVMHPGICPEYRNAHGCFWALARGDLGRVGMTLLKIDRGVDTGPVYEYFRCDYDEWNDSHFVIQTKVVLDNLDRIGAKLREAHEGHAAPMDTSGRPSAEWGQPRLTSYLAWKARARKRS